MRQDHTFIQSKFNTFLDSLNAYTIRSKQSNEIDSNSIETDFPRLLYSRTQRDSTMTEIKLF
jgi:hypothetical protein